MELKVGDRVQLTVDAPDGNRTLKKGDSGFILRAYPDEDGPYGWIVCWDKDLDGQGDGNDHYAQDSGQQGHIWCMYHHEIKLERALTEEERKKLVETRVLKKIKYLDKKFADEQKFKERLKKQYEEIQNRSIQNGQHISTATIARNWGTASSTFLPYISLSELFPPSD